MILNTTEQSPRGWHIIAALAASIIRSVVRF
jgi:hypothetical protein